MYADKAGGATLGTKGQTNWPASSRDPGYRSKKSFTFLFYSFCLFVCLFVFQDRVSLYSPSCPGTHFGDQAGLELRNPPASVSQVLGLKACATTAQRVLLFLLEETAIAGHYLVS